MASDKMTLGLRSILSSGKTSLARWAGLAAILVLLLSICFTGLSRAKDAETSPRANQTNSANFQTAVRDQMHADSELPQESHEAPKESQWQSFLISVEIAVCVLLMFRLIVPNIGKQTDKQSNPVTTAPPKAKPESSEKKAVADVARVSQAKPKSAAESAEQRKTVLEEFFKEAPGQLVEILKLFAQISRSPELAVRQKLLADLALAITSLKIRVGCLELAPAWHLASSLEKLISEFGEKPSNITPSTLRTVGSGLLVLKDLCAADVRQDLATEPPVQFLVVDDDPVSRHAISTCLKRLAQTPDLAEHGEAALNLAERKTYDAIFLDVEMPNLDGFEVCARIHKFEMNRSTPVVFVTSHDDSESHRKSTACGGNDLVAKPFLASEFTLKAVTLLFRARLDRKKADAELAEKTPAEALPAAEESPKAPPAPTPGVEIAKSQDNKRASEAAAEAQKDQKPDSAKENGKTPTPPGSQQIPQEFATHATECLREMQEQASALTATDSADERGEILSEMYVGLNMLRSDAAREGLKATCELTSALGKLITKLLDKSTLSTASALQAISAAIRLLKELARAGVEPELTNSPVRALVVDDEPLTRRAISNALQLSFGKPDDVENGETAVALAQSKAFDVIFLDIMMPKMDGYETCSKIRQTKLNGSTPIIFVTSHKDTESREKAFNCGGNGFISKPVLPAEIFLTALTFTLRARMGKNEGRTASAQMLEEAVC